MRFGSFFNSRGGWNRGHQTNHDGSIAIAASASDSSEQIKLSAKVTDADGVRGVRYQWQEKGDDGLWHDISGATGRSYTLDGEDAGKEFQVVATYKDRLWHTEQVSASYTAPGSPVPPTTDPGTPTPVPPVPPVVTPPDPVPVPPTTETNTPGAINVTSSSPNGFVEGATLSANVTDANGVGNVSYQWQSKGADGLWHDIAGATARTHTLGYDDGGKEFNVHASYTDGQDHAEQLTKSVEAVDVNRPGTISISSSSPNGYVQGATMSATVADADGVGSVNYHWQSKGTDGQWHDIAGSTGKSYTLSAQDGGKEFKVVADYVDNQHHTESLSASATSVPWSQVPDNNTNPGDGFMMGVNLAGGDFGSNVPGRYGTDYTYPTHSEVDYYASKGMEVIRLPFLWERVQHSKNGPLDATELAHIDDVVDYATSKGMKVVLDVHNFGSGFGATIGSSQTPDSVFADFWGKLAGHFADNPDVIFGLMNEPHSQSASQWINSANAAISAIRAAGADQQVLVPGSYWDGAWTWVSSDNDTVVGGGVKDPANNYAFEVHQYLDSDGSGSHSNVVSASVGVERLTAITNWAEQTGHKLFLGEFGVASDQTSLNALDQMVGYMKAHPDAWQGATYWAGGPWWGDYMYSIEPTNGQDKPQMVVLGHHNGA